jgi:hypothetical protein
MRRGHERVPVLRRRDGDPNRARWSRDPATGLRTRQDVLGCSPAPRLQPTHFLGDKKIDPCLEEIAGMTARWDGAFGRRGWRAVENRRTGGPDHS